jgi:hypothetical protein
MKSRNRKKENEKGEKTKMDGFICLRKGSPGELLRTRQLIGLQVP